MKMKREIKNDGVYVECDMDQMLDRFSELVNAQVGVITKGRIELADEEWLKFKAKFKVVEAANEQQLAGMNNQQKCDFIFRKMLLS